MCIRDSFFIIELDHIREISQIVIGIHLVNIDHRFSYHIVRGYLIYLCLDLSVLRLGPSSFGSQANKS